jgi:hypothetical protein
VLARALDRVLQGSGQSQTQASLAPGAEGGSTAAQLQSPTGPEAPGQPQPKGLPLLLGLGATAVRTTGQLELDPAPEQRSPAASPTTLGGALGAAQGLALT